MTDQASAGPHPCNSDSSPCRPWTCTRGTGAVGSNKSRFGVNGAGHLFEARHRSGLARWADTLLGWALVDVGEAHLLHSVEVVEVAPKFLEPVGRRQRIGVVAQVVLAELAGGVAQIEQDLGNRRVPGRK